MPKVAGPVFEVFSETHFGPSSKANATTQEEVLSTLTKHPNGVNLLRGLRGFSGPFDTFWCHFNYLGFGRLVFGA